ncbi:glutamate decarboxylase [Capronia epimyces CBS 606.96]|uniref:Glutamate decarboxylase n=1 Tax=Capronia epimyces CBS 606.96 TaxID=1182542 RepID=W9Y7R4_9EURO|nr:glutamate decarboxylase [Capronia epimyces CBS 606.96]EXJ88862.1 glutamate decarboxylase [Capronia epimyces CBS 606.96]
MASPGSEAPSQQKQQQQQQLNGVAGGVINGSHNGSHVHGGDLRTNGGGFDTSSPSLSRAQELKTLLSAVVDRLIPFVEAADAEGQAHEARQAVGQSALVDGRTAAELRTILTADGTLTLPEQGTGARGVLATLGSVLKYSVNTSSPGFLDKLYGPPVAPGIAAELVLGVLNTNLHVYQVSPALSVIETQVARALAGLFGLTGPRVGGISVQGGSASNLTSIVVARNTLFPETKALGNAAGGRSLVLFTSEHGHYSIEKAAQQCGFGSASVVAVPVDRATGAMDPAALDALVVREQARGNTPFYVNATAGTTVLGSFDPFPAIAAVARKHRLWLHIDGAWGGSFVFSDSLRRRALAGSHLADSIAINPHKMLGVPVTCSFLLLKDLRHAHRANTLRAGYLFHDEADDDDDDGEDDDARDPDAPATANGHLDEDNGNDDDHPWTPPDDLADLTLQCGRRGDSLKFLFAWQYYGSAGYRAKIEQAYSVARHLADLIDAHPDLALVSTNPPPCLQVCFYFAPGGKLVHGVTETETEAGTEKDEARTRTRTGKRNSALTSRISQALVPRGFLVDFAPALSHEVEKGSFFRAVVNISTTRATVERLVDEVVAAGRAILQNL